jgi:hypothetical protein
MQRAIGLQMLPARRNASAASVKLGLAAGDAGNTELLQILVELKVPAVGVETTAVAVPGGCPAGDHRLGWGVCLVMNRMVNIGAVWR